MEGKTQYASSRKLFVRLTFPECWNSNGGVIVTSPIVLIKVLVLSY